jgi:predicted nucleotidyltransferase
MLMANRPQRTTLTTQAEAGFLARVAQALATLPGVQAVTLGGSRAQGTHRPDSDWDLAVYYRDSFDPQQLRDLGWPGEVSELGGWGGGVFNGGAWLSIDGQPVDVHYRDLTTVEHVLAEAEHGRFWIEPLMFHLAGIPSYLVIAELAINQVLLGDLPRPDYPPALREAAPDVWWARAQMTFAYALDNHAAHGRSAQCAGLVVLAASQTAHAVLAARGEWITNEKTLLTRAGLDPLNGLIADFSPDPIALRDAAGAAKALCEKAVETADDNG